MWEWEGAESQLWLSDSEGS